MTSWKTSDIARRLAERDGVEPPEGLLEKIKQDIPAELPALPRLPEVAPRIPGRTRPPRHRVWLMAASLAAAVLGGVLALRVMETTPPPQEAAFQGKAEGTKRTETTQRTERTGTTKAAETAPRASTAPPKPAPLHRDALQAPTAPPPAESQRKDLPASPARQAAPPEEKAAAQAESQVEAKAVAGRIAGGVAGGVPTGVAGGASAKDETRADNSRDPWTVLPATPKVETDRINVGGNESGQQSGYAGPPPVVAPAPLLDERRLKKSVAGRSDAWDLVGRLSSGGEPPTDGETAVRAEGAPLPSASPGNERVLRFFAQDADARVDFNREAVSSWSRLGFESGAHRFTALYEVTLKPQVTGTQTIATLHLPDTTRELKIADLAATWDAASPGLRLAALAAELAEVRRGSTLGKAIDLGDLVRRAKKVAADLAGTPREQDAVNFLRLAEQAAQR
jgi:hypothetical protein